MTLKNFITRINWRQIVVHFAASWFFIHAFQILSNLYHLDIVIALRQSCTANGFQGMIDKGFTTDDLVGFLMWQNLSGLIGLITAFFISLAISIKYRWFWVNSLLVLIAAYTLYKFNFLGWPYLKKVFLIPGQIFETLSIRLLVNGLFVLLTGVLLLFLKPIKRFITADRGTAALAG
jgi:hypothetical protein